jgi:hypothetical protein
MRPLLVFALAAASTACAQPQQDAAAPPETAPQETDRAAAAGLTAAQADTLMGYQSGAVVPTLPEGWQLTDFANETLDEGGLLFPSYTLSYRRTDGACFRLLTASDGLGDVLVMAPSHMSEATAPGVALYDPIPVGWTEPGDPDDGWDGEYLASEWAGTDGLVFHIDSDNIDSNDIDSDNTEGCAMISSDDARALLEGVRYLDPTDDAYAGLWAFSAVDPEADDPAPVHAADPEAAARATYAGDAATTRVESIQGGERRRVVLVTNEGLRDDAVRDERVRAAYVHAPDGWMPPYVVGRQVRCQAGHGHQEWGAEACM